MAISHGKLIRPADKGQDVDEDDIKFAESEREERDILGRPRVGSRSGNSSVSRSRSRSYDYTGMDKAHEISQQAAAGEGTMYDAAMKDPLSIPGLTSRIGAMQRYVKAYKSGQDLPDQVVLPAVRLASESDSFSRSIGRAHSMVRDKLGQDIKEISPVKDPPVPPGQEASKGIGGGLPPGDNGMGDKGMGGGQKGGMGGGRGGMGDSDGPIGGNGDRGFGRKRIPPPPTDGRGRDDPGGQPVPIPLPPSATGTDDPGGQPVPMPGPRGGMKTYGMGDPVEDLIDPLDILKRIQEEMGLV